MTSDPTYRRRSSPTTDADPYPSRRARARRLVVLLFVVLVLLFAAGLWGTVVRPAAYEVRAEVVARAAPDLLLVRHQAVTALGMGAMEMMAVRGAPGVLDAAGLSAGERVRLAVRPHGDEIVLVWIERER